jgi:uncharacterized protein
MLNRYLTEPVRLDLNQKMVFIGGPRQVGKTTFALALLNDKKMEQSPAYLNWDALADRELILSGVLPAGQALLILDEIHKFSDWRNLVKGFYDKNKTAVSMLVTGSARLDYYRKGGDSLQGRYHYYRLHPFSLIETDPQASQSTVETLLRFGGFPEPFMQATENFHRRWLREMSARITHEDVRDLENVRENSKLDLLLHHLPNCVGSPLSVNSLRHLLQVAHESVERWLTIFDNLYVTFRLPPLGGDRIRAVKKEQKLYFRDWSRCADPGSRFENMVACHLLKYCHFIEDTEGYNMELRYLRDTDGREVDFVVLREGSPEFAVECKCGERNASPACQYFRERTEIPEFYQVHLGTKNQGNERTGTRILPFTTFCLEKNLP